MAGKGIRRSHHCPECMAQVKRIRDPDYEDQAFICQKCGTRGHWSDRVTRRRDLETLLTEPFYT